MIKNVNVDYRSMKSLIIKSYKKVEKKIEWK